MSMSGGGYWAATRHPWSCVLFVVPLLTIYEVGLYFLGPMTVETLRNGADIWLRTGLSSAGISSAYGAPVALVLLLLSWTLLYRDDRPRDAMGVWIGMTVESLVFAAIFYGISLGVWPMLQSLKGMVDGSPGIPALMQSSLAADSPHAPQPALVNLVRYFGAGIYEETLFRLLFLSVLLAAFNLVDFSRGWCLAIAGLASALFFAWAHNLGPRGEAFQISLFLFRTMAGVYFAWIYCVRGFGIAVGAHAGYDVIVGFFAEPPV